MTVDKPRTHENIIKNPIFGFGNWGKLTDSEADIWKKHTQIENDEQESDLSESSSGRESDLCLYLLHSTF